MKKYNEEHEWVEVDGEIATVGISSYAVEQLGDITFKTDVPVYGGYKVGWTAPRSSPSQTRTRPRGW